MHELFKRAHFASDLGRSEGRIPAIWLRVQLYHVDLLFLGEGRTNTVGHPAPPAPGPGVVGAVRLCGVGIIFYNPNRRKKFARRRRD